jgi:hypothetical protein
MLLPLFINAAFAEAGEQSTTPRALKSMDLRNSDELAWLKKNNPSHYEKIQKILYAHDASGSAPAENWMRVHMKAGDVNHSHVTLTSLPAKKVLRFVLDDVRYTVIVVAR